VCLLTNRHRSTKRKFRDSPLPDLKLEYKLPNVPGSVAMARHGPNSGNSEFFINISDNTEHLGTDLQLVVDSATQCKLAHSLSWLCRR